VSTYPTPPDRRVNREQAKELLGVGCLAAGWLTVTVAAFLFDPLAGVAWIGALLLMLGSRLTTY